MEDLISSNLLAQRDAITNWDKFAEQAGIMGWDNTTAVCAWSGIVCLGGSSLNGFTL